MVVLWTINDRKFKTIVKSLIDTEKFYVQR